MTGIVLSVLGLSAIAAVVYLGRERLGAEGVGLAALRTIAFGALVVAFFNPITARRQTGGPPTVLLDGSLSMAAAGGRWDEARDTAAVLAGSGGTVFRVGSGGLTPDDSAPPTAGESRLADALRTAAARPGRVILITDGEIADGSSLPPSLLQRLDVVHLPRDTVSDVAILDVVAQPRMLRGDTLELTYVLGLWGTRADTSVASVTASVDGRRLVTERVPLPAGSGVVRRTVRLAPGSISDGTHTLSLLVTVDGDREERNNERTRLITVSAQPEIVVLVDPADVEGRYLVRELQDVARAGVQGFARVESAGWREMNSLQRVPASTVRDASENAALLVVRGRTGLPATRSRALWTWPAGSDRGSEYFDGDWYVSAQLPPSPLAGGLATIEWDSLPPLIGVVPVVAGGEEWVAATGRLGRRGADQPLLIGRDSSGARQLTTSAAGLWRWVLRGGAAREAYRAIVATGTDWLLRTGLAAGDGLIVTTPHTTRGAPVAFTWTGPTAPDSVTVTLTGPDSVLHATVHFDASGVALLTLPPGVYSWSADVTPRAVGTTVVESFSSEFHPGPVTLTEREGDGGFALVIQAARERWWLFTLAMMSFIGEWAWRQRRGLP